MNTTKGQVEFQKVLVSLVLVIVSITLIVLFLKPFQTAAEDLFNENLCRAEIQAHTTGLTLTARQFEAEIHCPRGELVELDIDDSETNKWIAESMRKCWFAFLEGEKDLFVDDSVYCHACQVFGFTGDNDKLYGTNDYMKNTNIPGKSVTYFEYIQGFVSDDAENVRKLKTEVENLMEVNEESWKGTYLEKDKQYATMFVFAKGKDNVKDVFSHLTLQTTEGKVAFTASTVSGFIMAGKAAAGAFSVGVVLTTFGVSAGPVGWAVLLGGATTQGFLGGFALAETVQLAILNQIESSERAVFVVLTEHTAENYEKLNCDYEPIPIKT